MIQGLRALEIQVGFNLPQHERRISHLEFVSSTAASHPSALEIFCTDSIGYWCFSSSDHEGVEVSVVGIACSIRRGIKRLDFVVIRSSSFKGIVWWILQILEDNDGMAQHHRITVGTPAWGIMDTINHHTLARLIRVPRDEHAVAIELESMHIRDYWGGSVDGNCRHAGKQEE